MFGSTVGVLRVYVQQSGSNRLPIWELTGASGNVWKSGRVKIPPQAKDFKVGTNIKHS